MKYIIIEDEDNGANLLHNLVSQNFAELSYGGRAKGVPDGIELINKIRPSILFLDIEIERGSGFDILDKVKLKNTLIIFTTGYNEFAIRAIRYGAYDYLLKPIQKDEFFEAVSKAIQTINEGKANNQNFINPVSDNFENIILPYKNERIMVKPIEIVCMEADGKYCNVTVESMSSIISSYNIGHYESILPKELFIRVHNSFLVNRLHVSKIDTTNSQLIMKNGDRIIISKRKLKEVIDFI